jgi:hypothetical protein
MKAGTAKAKATDAALSVAGTGNEQLAVLFEFIEGENKGEQITAYLSFTDKTFKRTVKTLRDMGWDGDDFSVFAAEGCAALLQNPVDVTVREGVDLNGVPRWEAQVGAGLAIKEKMDQAQAVDFSQRMKARMLTMQQNGQLPNGPGPAKAPAAGPGGAQQPGNKPVNF